MSRRKLQRMFDPGRPVFARRTMRVADQTFESGQEIPWRELEVSKHSVAMWFRLRRISHYRDGDQSREAYAETHPGREFSGAPLTNEQGERLDGPTIEDWVDHGYLPEDYPPSGWAIVESDPLIIWRLYQEGDQECRELLPWDDFKLDEKREHRAGPTSVDATIAEISEVLTEAVQTEGIPAPDPEVIKDEEESAPALAADSSTSEVTKE